MSDEANTHDTRALEALFFVSDEPLTSSVLAQALDVDRRTVESMCDRLQRDLEDRGSGLVLRSIAGGWRLYTHPDTAAVVEQFVLSSRQARLTKPVGDLDVQGRARKLVPACALAVGSEEA